MYLYPRLHITTPHPPNHCWQSRRPSLSVSRLVHCLTFDMILAYRPIFATLNAALVEMSKKGIGGESDGIVRLIHASCTSPKGFKHNPEDEHKLLI